MIKYGFKTLTKTHIDCIKVYQISVIQITLLLKDLLANIIIFIIDKEVII